MTEHDNTLPFMAMSEYIRRVLAAEDKMREHDQVIRRQGQLLDQMMSYLEPYQTIIKALVARTPMYDAGMCAFCKRWIEEDNPHDADCPYRQACELLDVPVQRIEP